MKLSQLNSQHMFVISQQGVDKLFINPADSNTQKLNQQTKGEIVR